MLLFSCVFAGAQIIDDQQLYTATELDLFLTIDSGFDVLAGNNPTLNYFDASVNFLPTTTISQEVMSLKTYPGLYNVDTFRWTTLEDTYDFTIQSYIQSRREQKQITRKLKFPIESLDTSFDQYLSSSDYVTITSEVRDIASTLATGEDDLFIVVAKISKWVTDNIEYDLSTLNAQTTQPASYVLRTRQGVCDEITVLFISMLRSLGIPARFVSGIAYSNSELFDYPWGFHGWAEVYFPGHGWISVDPTYDEIAFVDATHIKLLDSPGVQNPSITYEWLGHNVEIVGRELAPIIEVKKIGNPYNDNVEISAQVFEDVVDFKSYNGVRTIVKNRNAHYVALNLYSSHVEGLEQIVGKQIVILTPFEEKTVYFVYKLTGAFKNDYKYTFPLTVYLNENVEADVSFSASREGTRIEESDVDVFIKKSQSKVQADANAVIELDCNVPGTVYKSQTFNINCTVSNTGNIYLKDLELCYDNCLNITSPISSKENYLFTESFNESGRKKINIELTGTDIYLAQQLELGVAQKAFVQITNVSEPQTINYEGIAKVNFLLTPYSDPQNIKLTIKINNRERTYHYQSMESPLNFIFEVLGQDLKEGSNTVQLFVEYDSRYGIKTSTANAQITLLKLTLWQKVQVTITQLYYKLF